MGGSGKSKAGLTVISPSVWRKPNGLFVVPREHVIAFLTPVIGTKFHGIVFSLAHNNTPVKQHDISIISELAW